MADVRQKECPSCGAPLPVDANATSVKCQYCGNTIQIERKKPPRNPDPVAPPTVYVPSGLPKAVVWAIVGTTVLPFVGSLVVFLGGSVFGAVKGATVSFPLTCGMNEELRIVGRTFSGTGTLVKAGMNCKLRIEDSKLSGDVIVDGALNDEVTIVNSTLEANGVAIRFEQNGTLHTSGRTAIRGKETALVGGLNTKADFEDTEIHGDVTGIVGDLNTELRATRTKITGHDAAVVFSTNGHLFGWGTTISGEVDGIDGEVNLEVSLEGSTVEASEIGIKGAGNLHARVLKKSRVTGKIAAFDAGDNLELTIDDGAVESAGTGAVARWNPHLKIARGGTLKGGTIGLDGGENLELTLSKGTVESQGTALCGRHNAQIEGRDGAITGTVAMHFERPPQERLSGTTVSGSRLFDGAGCAQAPARTPETPVQRRGPLAAVPAHTPPPTPVAKPPGPAFDSSAAVIALDAATRAASAQCRSSSGKPERVWVVAGFAPDGRNSGASVSGAERGTPGAACVERVFRGVSIPPFDPATRPSGLSRPVDLK